MKRSAWKLSRKSRRQLGLAAAVVGLLVAVHTASAQLQGPQGVYNSVPMYDTFGALLPGNTDPVNSNTCTVVPGCVVEILSDGSNNVAHVANLDGSPSGGDTILFSTFVGEGIPPCDSAGQIDTSFNGPAAGTKIYARVFNAPTVAKASYWGQSADFTVTIVSNATQAMNLSALGMEITTMPIGINLSTVDSKGVTYLEELVAGTNPQNPDDTFDVNGIALENSGQSVQVGANGKAGRQYTLQRTTNDLSGIVTWTNIVSTGVLNVNGNVLLNDPSPPKTTKAFYRVQIALP
jgi:hypothetical protein